MIRTNINLVTILNASKAQGIKNVSLAERPFSRIEKDMRKIHAIKWKPQKKLI